MPRQKSSSQSGTTPLALTLSERIAARANQQSQVRRNRAAFLALRSDIEAALADGWSARAVWETLRSEESIAFGYDAFLSYVRKAAEQRRRSPSNSKSRPQVPNAPQGFTFTATPNKEDLF